jgi:hypothetical protein
LKELYPVPKGIIIGFSIIVKLVRGDYGTMGYESEIIRLEERVKFLEYRIKQLLQLVVPEKHPFTYLCLESELTEDQEDRIFQLMDEVQKGVGEGKLMRHEEFEERVYNIVPARRGNYSFAEGIVATLNETNQYAEVYQHMKKDGMNI